MRAASLLVLSATLLGGCVTTIPDGSPTALMRFTSNVTLGMFPGCGQYSASVTRGMIGLHFMHEESPVKMLGTRPGKRNDVVERLVPAEHEIGFRLNGGITTGSSVPGQPTGLVCNMSIAFTPRKGEQYHAHYELDIAGKVCTVRLYRLSETNGTIERTPVRWRRFKESLWGTAEQTCPAEEKPTETASPRRSS